MFGCLEKENGIFPKGNPLGIPERLNILFSKVPKTFPKFPIDSTVGRPHFTDSSTAISCFIFNISHHFLSSLQWPEPVILTGVHPLQEGGEPETGVPGSPHADSDMRVWGGVQAPPNKSQGITSVLEHSILVRHCDQVMSTEHLSQNQ